MLEKLLLVNFQGHEKSLLQFCPYVNVIVGKSDMGKSSILRALWWLYKGQPGGDSIIRKGCENGHVTAKFDNVKITRGRKNTGKEKNVYMIDGDKLKAFGLNVPEEVLKALNLTDLNFTRQMDGPFLLSMTPSEVATYLNDLIDLNVITNTLQAASSYIRTVNSKIKKAEADVETQSETLKTYSWFDKAEEMVNKAEKYEVLVSKGKEKINNLYTTINDFHNVLEQVEKYRYLADVTTLMTRCSGLFDKYAELEKQTQEIKTILDRCKAELAKLESFYSISKADKLIDDFLRLEKDLKDQDKAYKTFLDTLRNYRQSVKDLEKSEKAAEAAKAEFEQKMPPVCPLCGNKREDG